MFAYLEDMVITACPRPIGVDQLSIGQQLQTWGQMAVSKNKYMARYVHLAQPLLKDMDLLEPGTEIHGDSDSCHCCAGFAFSCQLPHVHNSAVHTLRIHLPSSK